MKKVIFLLDSECFMLQVSRKILANEGAMLKSQDVRSSVLSSALLIGLLGVSGAAFSQAANFQLSVNNAITFTDFYPNGISDNTPPYTLCRGHQLSLRLKYTWRHSFAEQISTEPVGSFYPQFFTQGMAPNPLYLPATSASQPLIRLVDTGLIVGPVNTAGLKTVTYRGRTLLNYDPATGQQRTPLTAQVAVLIDTQFAPSSTRYREIANNTNDMPTRPWFAWTDDLATTGVSPPTYSDRYRIDVDSCTDQSLLTGNGNSCSNMEFSPFTTACSNASNTQNSDYCHTGDFAFHQVPVSLAPNTAYEYRVLGRSTCGVSDEIDAIPVRRPFFRTAQACFVSGAGIPDGGVLNLDVSTLIADASIPNALAPNLRVTVHSDHSRVSDLKVSLRKTFPETIGPVVLMDRPAGISGGGTCDAKRIQAVFGNGGTFVNGACRTDEPALRGSLSPLESLTTFAPARGAGNWRLTVEDVVPNGQAGSLLEWCISSDIPVIAAPFSQPLIMSNGFEDGGSL